MIEHMVEYLSACPALDGVMINVNYLEGKPPACSLEYTSHEPVLRKYADGGMLCEKRFVLALREESTLATKRNMKVAIKCELIENWIKEQNKAGIMPRLDDGFIPSSLEVVKGFCVTQTASMDMRFEAELRLVFYTDNYISV